MELQQVRSLRLKISGKLYFPQLKTEHFRRVADQEYGLACASIWPKITKLPSHFYSRPPKPAMRTPQYLKIKAELRKQILEGVYQEQAILPSEHELAALHGVARSTVRQALEELVKEGLIEKQQGRGSVVKRQSLGLLSFRGFSDSLERSQHPTTSCLLAPASLQPWPKPFFYPLSRAERKEPCWYLPRLRLVQAEPVMLEYTYLPSADLSGFGAEPLVDGSLFRTLSQQYHLTVNRVEQDLRAIEAQGEAAQLLEVAAGTPLLHLYRRYGTTEPDFFVYSSLFCHTGRYAIGTEFG